MSGEKALVGEYKLLELVGEGSFGKVWKARKVGDLRTVAIKLIPKRGKKDKDIRGLRQEIDILRKLRHRNIIEMIDAFETGSDFCVVTEFAQGELFEILETDTSLSEEVVQTLAGQLVDALHYLHSNRIIHRDMKPQNILIAADGTVKLCDFGFARAMSQNTVVLTSIKGTPLYMAPELVQEKPYTHAVDLWSLGVILYELFVGKPPFYTSSIYALIKQIVHDPPVYPSSMSGPFKSFLKGLLEKDPNRRLDWPEIMNHPFVAKFIKDRRTEEECRVVSSQRVESTEVPATSTAPHHAHHKAAPSQKRSSPSKSGINVPGASPAMRKPNGGSTNQGHEPMFLDPPQFSPQGSPGDGPMGSAIAASSLSKAAGSASPLSYPQHSPPILTVLVDAERKAKKGEYTDAVNVLLNPSILEAIKGALNPPSSGLALTKWCKLQETQHVVTLLDQILAKLPANASLQEVDPTGQLVSVLVLLAKAAHLCVGANPQFSAGAAGVLRKCNDWVISLETVSLCCELVSSRTSWAVVEEGCCGIRHWALKSQYTVLDKASRFKVMSEKVIDTLCKKRVAGRICRCIEDNARSSQSQSESLDIAALTCLATLLPCSHGSVTDLESRADWSPCLLLCEDVQAVMNTLKISDSSHLLSLWILTTQSIYESNETFKSLLRQVRENSQPVSSSMLICMLSRLMRLEPRISKTVCLSKVTDGLLRNSSKTRMISSALLLSNVCEGISKTCAPKDVAFVEQQFASSIFDAMKGQWIPMITNKKADTVLTAALCDAIGSFMLLFFRYWSIGSRYSHVTALKSCVPVIRDILDTWTVTPGAPAFSSIEGAPCPRGLVDGPMRFVHGFALFDHKGAIDTGLVSCVMNIIGSLGSNSNSYAMEMTPVGLLNALQCIQIGVENSLDALEVLVEDECLVKTLISIMSPNFLAATKKFYAGAGAVERNLLHEYISGKSSGSMSLANNILAAALSILQAPWTHTSIFTSDVDKILDPIKNHLSLESNIIPYLVGILHSVNFDDPCGKILLPSSAAMLARLVLIHGDEAVVIFARSGGLDGAVLETLLNAGNSDSMLASALLVVSQLARTATSKHQIEKFVDSGIMTLIPPLLSESTSSGVRARACNLLGNLCRYSDAVYPSIQELGILPPLIELCQDDDRSTRKFACFAIGNAGFHSDYLYEDLQHAVPILVGLLEDEEDRTRANAAGALGNLVRNSSLLVPKMLSCGAVESLLRIIREAISAVEGKSTAFQIALFSLGNLAAHHECLPKFQDLRVADVMLEVESTTKNSTILKYANRVLTKMNTASSGSKSRSKTKVQQTPLRERDSDKSMP